MIGYARFGPLTLKCDFRSELLIEASRAAMGMIAPASQECPHDLSLIERSTVVAPAGAIRFYEMHLALGRIAFHRFDGGLYYECYEENRLFASVVEAGNEVHFCVPPEALAREQVDTAMSSYSFFLGPVLGMRLLDRTGLIMHASCVRLQRLGLNILYCGSTGVGKSTSASLMVRSEGDDAVLVADDKAMVFCGPAGWYVSSADRGRRFGLKCNRAEPTRECVIVFPAQTLRNHAVRLDASVVASRLLGQVWMPLWDTNAIAKLVEIVGKLASTVRGYTYECTASLDAPRHLLSVVTEERASRASTDMG